MTWRHPVTPTPHPIRSAHRRQAVGARTAVKRILLIVVVLLLAGTAGGAWWWARQSLVPLDGELRVSGLLGPVEILFDGSGVPHAYANGPEDAWMAAGR